MNSENKNIVHKLCMGILCTDNRPKLPGAVNALAGTQDVSAQVNWKEDYE